MKKKWFHQKYIIFQFCSQVCSDMLKVMGELTDVVTGRPVVGQQRNIASTPRVVRNPLESCWSALSQIVVYSSLIFVGIKSCVRITPHKYFIELRYGKNGRHRILSSLLNVPQIIPGQIWPDTTVHYPHLNNPYLLGCMQSKNRCNWSRRCAT